jgi:hypothetical protein
MSDDCGVCSQAEEFLAALPSASAGDEQLRIGYLAIALHRHRTEIELLRRRLELRELERRRAP